MNEPKMVFAWTSFALIKSALALTALSSDFASSSLIATAMIAKIAFPNSSAVIPTVLKISVVFGHFALTVAPQLSGPIDGSLLAAVSSVLATASLSTALINFSILSKSSLVSGMAPAALVWSGGTSARIAGAIVKAKIAQRSGKAMCR